MIYLVIKPYCLTKYSHLAATRGSQGELAILCDLITLLTALD